MGEKNNWNISAKANHQHSAARNNKLKGNFVKKILF